PDGVHRTPGPIDAIAAQLARRLGQLRQVQRDHAAALDATAAGPVGKKGKAHARPLAESQAKSGRVLINGSGRGGAPDLRRTLNPRGDRLLKVEAVSAGQAPAFGVEAAPLFASQKLSGTQEDVQLRKQLDLGLADAARQMVRA